MPGRNGTGPNGEGPMTGGGFGDCASGGGAEVTDSSVTVEVDMTPVGAGLATIGHGVMLLVPAIVFAACSSILRERWNTHGSR